MKIKATATLLALLVTSVFAQATASATSRPVSVNLAVKGTAEELTALERTKIDYIFGTPEQKRVALSMFGPDFHGISYGPNGPSRGDYTDTVAKLTGTLFPVMPPGTFKISDVQVLSLQPGCAVVSYVISGPGPDGKPWTSYLSSTWVRHGKEWKTSFYQATLAPQS